MKQLFINLQFAIPIILFLVLFNSPIVAAPELKPPDPSGGGSELEEPLEPASVVDPTVKKITKTVKKVEPKKIVKPKPVGISGNCESYRPLVAKHFPANQVNNALLVMSKESGCRPDAVNKANRNGSVDYGLFQVNSVHKAKVGNNVSKLYDVETNIRIAAGIYKARGNWSAWYAVCTPSKVAKYSGIHCK